MPIDQNRQLTGKHPIIESYTAYSIFHNIQKTWHVRIMPGFCIVFCSATSLLMLQFDA
jgi:hypothetical protein